MWLIEKLKQRLWVIPTLVFTILVILGANMHPLWGDEAETALFARNILKYGLPKGWDGVNIMGINNAVVLNKDLVNYTSPWLQYYTAAASFLLFPQTSFAARLPFIIFSVLSMPLLYFLTLKLTKDKLSSFITVLIAGLSVPFILFSYQARYYALTSFAGLALAISIFKLTEKNWRWKVVFVLSGVFFFYANYVVFAAFYLSLSVSYLIYLLLSKKSLKSYLFNLFVASIFIAVCTLPWFLKMKPFEGRGEIVRAEVNISYIKDFAALLKESYRPFNQNNALPILLIPLLFGFIFYLVRAKKNVAFILFPSLLTLFYLFLMTLATAVAMTDTAFIHVRYTMSIFPFMSIISGVIAARIIRWNKAVGGLFLVLFIATNLLTLQKPRSFLTEFLKEAANPYPSPDKVVADYLAKNAKEGDTAFVSLDRNHEPLIFYLGDKIRFVNRVSRTNRRLFPWNRSVLPRYIYDFRENPDWIILYSKRGNYGTFLTFDYRFLSPGINMMDYKEVVLPIFFSDMSRPEIEYRSFKEINPGYNDQVFIYSLR